MTPSSTPRGSLIARLEGAEVGSRELDALVYCALPLREWEVSARPAAKPWRVTARYTSGGWGTFRPPAYTTSLDAVVQAAQDHGVNALELLSEAAEDTGVSGYFTDRALAPQIARNAAIALLKALEAQDDR